MTEKIQGVIFPVERKGHSACPDYTGVIRFEDGREIKIVGWDRENRNKIQFIKITSDRNILPVK